MPITLQKLAAARTQGRQSIHRAELSAILFLFESFPVFCVRTDSQTAITLVETCMRATHVHELADHDDFDLLRRVFSVRSRNNMQ